MRLRVLKEFVDKYTKEEYEVGQEIEVTEVRAFEIIYNPKLGTSFVEPILGVTTETVEYYNEEPVTIVFPNHVGGGHYELSNGDKVKGKEAAIKAEAALQEQE